MQGIQCDNRGLLRWKGEESHLTLVLVLDHCYFKPWKSISDSVGSLLTKASPLARYQIRQSMLLTIAHRHFGSGLETAGTARGCIFKLVWNSADLLANLTTGSLITLNPDCKTFVCLFRECKRTLHNCILLTCFGPVQSLIYLSCRPQSIGWKNFDNCTIQRSDLSGSDHLNQPFCELLWQEFKGTRCSLTLEV